MTKRKFITFIIVCISALAVVFIVRQCLEHYRPLTKTDQWEATVSYSGNTETIPVYEMAGFSDRLLGRVDK